MSPYLHSRVIAGSRPWIEIAWMGRELAKGVKPEQIRVRESVDVNDRTWIPLEGWHVDVITRDEDSVLIVRPENAEQIKWRPGPGLVGRYITIRLARPAATFTALVEPDPRVGQYAASAAGSGNGSDDGPLDEIEQSLGGVRRDLDQMTAFALATDGGTRAAPRDETDAQAVVDAQVRRIFGRMPDPHDVTGTLAALDRNLAYEEVDGIGRWVLKPYSVAVLADTGGGVTGRQRSLSVFADQVRDEMLPLAAALQPLRPSERNPSELAAAVSGFSRSIEAFTAETANATGIIEERATLLLGQARVDLGRIGAELGMLSPVDGLPEWEWPPTRLWVITPGDEEQFTNYGIVRDRFNALGSAYASFTGSDDPITVPGFGGAARDLGQDLTLLDRDMDLVAEVADELDDAFLSVNMGPDERRATPIFAQRLDGPSIQDLIERARTFSSTEGRPLTQEGGVRGVALLADRLDVLRAWTGGLLSRAKANGYVPHGLGHGRVRAALGKLDDVLDDTIRDADRIAPRPAGDAGAPSTSATV